VLFACKKDDASPEPQPGDEGGIPTSDGAPGVDAARREAGVPTKCATYAGSTSSDECACGEQSSPLNGPPTDKCPINDNPHYCVSYDVVDPPPLRRECGCQPKCLFQHVGSGSSSGEGGAGGVDTCRCGVSSHLVLGGDGSKDESRPTCEGYTVCCRDNSGSGCDCTNDGAYTCPMTSTKVPSCTPDDFNEASWKAVVYGSPSYSDLTDVPKCR
jgi:hypothetical protein